MKIKFTKMHGLGNDFIIINNLIAKLNFSQEDIKYLCDRKLGIGCDQLLLVDKATDNKSDFYYRIYNSDGSLAGQCGNGARCFIRYVIETGLTTKSEILLQTRERIICGKMKDKENIEVEMGQPEFEPRLIPLKARFDKHYTLLINGKEIRFSAVSMGNPHAVIIVDDKLSLEDDDSLAAIGKALQTSELFPESVNVNFVYVIDRSTILLRTYERGSGFTLACGSGACASAVIAIRDGLTDVEVKVVMPGGNLAIKWQPGSSVVMCGSATKVFDGEIEL